ncbi:hypothetical protein FACS1894137_12880 [Spirochaetia bacterium]|nr:hypothetical protein FACS1894137_12880 [Spirochaetia bacterium]
MKTIGIKTVVIFIILFSVPLAAFAEDSPLTGMEFNTLVVTLNGQRFTKAQVAESWREQSGSVIFGDHTISYWLYDSLAYHSGKSDDIYNRYIPSWVEKMGYAIDYDRINIIDPNPGLAPSVQALMTQRDCNVSVTLIKYYYGYDYVVINEWFKSRSAYKTTAYLLHSKQATVRFFEHYKFPSNDGVVDLGLMTETAAGQRIETEFNDLFKNDRYASYGRYFNMDQNSVNDVAGNMIGKSQQGHLYKVWYNAASLMDNVGPDYLAEFLGYIWIGPNDTYIFTLYEPRR